MNSVVESMEDPARRFLNTSVAGGADEGQLCSGTDLGKVILVPGLAALGLTFLCMWLLNKKINALWIIMGMFAVGIAGAATGFLGL